MAKTGRYEAVVGVNYVPDGKNTEVRREPGERFDDLPERAGWAIEQGYVRDTQAKAKEED